LIKSKTIKSGNEVLLKGIESGEKKWDSRNPRGILDRKRRRPVNSIASP
jgi:hypothetical protein